MKSLYKHTIPAKQGIADIYIPLENQIGRPAAKDEINRRIEGIKKDSYAKGYAAGVAFASQEQRKAYDEKIVKLDEKITHVIDLIPGEIKEVIKAVEEQVVKLTFSIAKKVIKKEIENKEHIINLIKALLQNVSDKTEILLKLNAEDIKILRDEGLELKLSSDVRELKVVEDNSVTKGGCLIESNLGWVDAKIETQILEIEKNLLGIPEPSLKVETEEKN